MVSYLDKVPSLNDRFFAYSACRFSIGFKSQLLAGHDNDGIKELFFKNLPIYF